MSPAKHDLASPLELTPAEPEPEAAVISRLRACLHRIGSFLSFR
ncbi:hypothetical protein ACTHPH_15840 [Paenibacillus pasadenensis]|uniref:Uncharacterized protein n=1 Tax=Paenibacillus pasadenensis TaxID=217090 RepID=A0A2N5N0F0_9BACL|nr:MULTISPECIES: hypothetical protein [Paenibacillus]PLT43818.1 hypothetical protein B8V81_2249 [Paenibacillus pasadenensis]